jgi:chaperonin GroEL (HSP60 family)
LYESGIIDPVKVTKSSLKTAISIALLVLTTEVAIIGGENDEMVLPHMG